MKTRIAIFFILIVCPILSFAQFEKASYMINGNTLPYRLFFPKNYNSKQKYPLLILLHGAGERGNNNEDQLAHGRYFISNNFYDKFPAIVIIPQCPLDSYWANVERDTIGDKLSFNFDISEKPNKTMETLIYVINKSLESNNVNTNQSNIDVSSMGYEFKYTEYPQVNLNSCNNGFQEKLF